MITRRILAERHTNPSTVGHVIVSVACHNVAIVVGQSAAFKDVAHPSKLQSISGLRNTNDGDADGIVVGHNINIQRLLVVALVYLKRALISGSNVAPIAEPQKAVTSVVTPGSLISSFVVMTQAMSEGKVSVTYQTRLMRPPVSSAPSTSLAASVPVLVRISTVAPWGLDSGNRDSRKLYAVTAVPSTLMASTARLPILENWMKD